MSLLFIYFVVSHLTGRTLAPKTVYKASQAYVPSSCLLAHKQSCSGVALSTLTDVMSAFYIAVHPLRVEAGELYLIES